MIIDGKTILYGIIGDPVRHSLSPLMHNVAFQEKCLNAVYLPFHAPDIASAVTGIRGLGIKGVSVTIPHKERIIDLLDVVDPVAAKIGAVNTVVRKDDKLVGYNTDWLGACRPLEERLSLAGCRVVILGAGGSARAIGFGMGERGAEYVIASRTESRGRALATELGCPWFSLAEPEKLAGDVLINATSVGMEPATEKSPVPRSILSGFKVVMDIVYAPLETTLLREARDSGCEVVTGLEMLLHQGVAQFEMWTGKRAPVDTMRKVLFDKLKV